MIPMCCDGVWLTYHPSDQREVNPTNEISKLSYLLDALIILLPHSIGLLLT